MAEDDSDHRRHDGDGGGSDPTFYRTPEDAAAAPAEELAYVAAFHRDGPRARRCSCRHRRESRLGRLLEGGRLARHARGR